MLSLWGAKTEDSRCRRQRKALSRRWQSNARKRRRSDRRGRAVIAEDVAQRAADLAKRGVRFDGGENRRHQVIAAGRRCAQLGQRAAYSFLVALGAELAQAFA